MKITIDREKSSTKTKWKKMIWLKQHDKENRNDAVFDSDREIYEKGGSDNVLKWRKIFK